MLSQARQTRRASQNKFVNPSILQACGNQKILLCTQCFPFIVYTVLFFDKLSLGSWCKTRLCSLHSSCFQYCLDFDFVLMHMLALLVPLTRFAAVM